MARSRVSATTRVIDRGWAAQISNTQRLSGRGVKVGIQAGDGSDGGVDLLDILIYNEFGTRRIPARPVMRSYYDTYAAQIGKFSDQGVTYALRTGDAVGALKQIGTYLQAGLQAHWRASKSWAVPNAPYTVAMKGSDVPLIDNGTLINSVRWQLT